MIQAMLNLPSWIPGSMQDRSADKLGYSKPRQTPVVEIPPVKKLKRNRSDSSARTSSPDKAVAKRRRMLPSPESPEPTNHLKTTKATAEQTTAAHRPLSTGQIGATPSKTLNAWDTSQHCQPKKVIMPSVVTDPERRTELLHKIESQLNLEILLKHNELRLIDQELAKCLVALEQIRRCEAIPYPGEHGSTTPLENLSSGVGTALEPLPGFSRPQQPPPWGVIDGPYSRHYAQWLLPDPQFDPTPYHSPRHSASFAGTPFSFFTDSRATRGGLSDRRMASKSRSSGSISNNLHPLSTSYATPKDKQGPLIIKRPTDGQMVKLVCTDCQRDNFSSVQGFLNHCRIAHGRNLDSHGAAAIACGVPVDASETTTTTTDTTTHSEPVLTTPVTGRVLVHPFITTAQAGKGPGMFPSVQTTTTTLPKASRKQKSTTSSKASKPVPFQFSKIMTSGQFVPSSSTPRLSALVQKHGLGADFSQIVGQAKQKIDLDQVEELEDDDDDQNDGVDAMEIDAPATAPKATGKPKPSVGGVRIPTSRAHRPTPLRTSLAQSNASSVAGSVITDTPTDEERTDFSPNTMETNPGLISDRDDEDYEDRESRSSEDEWSLHGADHSVQVRHHHHRDDEHIGLLDGVESMEAGTTCANVTETLATATPIKRKRGRPSKRGKK